jgi:hypothetical protein
MSTCRSPIGCRPKKHREKLQRPKRSHDEKARGALVELLNSAFNRALLGLQIEWKAVLKGPLATVFVGAVLAGMDAALWLIEQGRFARLAAGISFRIGLRLVSAEKRSCAGI